jgi:hypothetical protein
MSRQKQIGTAGETAVARAARTRGFPGADRRALAGRDDKGDVLLGPGVIAEVKSGKVAATASSGQIEAWLVETEQERVNAGAEFAVLVTKRAGVGAANAHMWWAFLRLGDLARLCGWPHRADEMPVDEPVRMTFTSVLAALRANGYGTPTSAGEAPHPVGAGRPHPGR